VEYAFAVGRGPTIGLDELPPEFREKKREAGVRASARSPTGASDRVRAALEDAGGDLDTAAAALGVSRTTFWRMRKRAGL